MSRRVKSLDEIRESRLLFDKNPPAFGYILITVVAVFLIVAVVWSIKTPKVYTIQAQGTVTNDESNYVMCSYTGEILDSNMEEGALVEAGDVLFTIKSTDYDLQQTQLEDNRKSYEEQISQYSLLIKSIKDDTNYFDETKADDGLYWSLFETYKSQVEQNKVDVSTYQAYGYTDEQIQALEPYFYYVDREVVLAIEAANDDMNTDYTPDYPDPLHPEDMQDPVPVGICLTDCKDLTDTYPTPFRVVSPSVQTTAAPAQVVTLILADWTPRASFSFFSVTLRFCPSAPEKNGTVSVRAMALLSVSTWVGCW